jgi:hypothetical protein
MSGATLQDEPVSRPTVPPLLEEIEAETSPREQVVILEPRAMPNGMGNLHNVMANKGALVDLMHGELLTGTAGLGEEWRIPIYRWSER